MEISNLPNENFMPVIAIYALIATVLFGSGYGTCWKVMNQQVATLHAQIQVSNEEARRVLLERTAAVEQAEADRAASNQQLENEREKNIQLVNTTATDLSNVRMRVRTSNKNCSSPLRKETSTPVVDEGTSTTELPEDFAELLRRKAKECDEVGIYAIEAFKYLNN